MMGLEMYLRPEDYEWVSEDYLRMLAEGLVAYRLSI